MDKLIIEYVSSSNCYEGDLLWVNLHYGNDRNRRCCYIKRSKDIGWEWYSGASEPDMASDLRGLFHGSPGEYALDALFAKPTRSTNSQFQRSTVCN